MAASVGVLGGVGGALVGGFLTNQAQQNRLESEREAERINRREDAYAAFLATVHTLVLNGQIVTVHPDEISDEDIDDAINAAFSAEAAVDVVVPNEVQALAEDLVNLLGQGQEEWEEVDEEEEWDEIFNARQEAIRVVQKDLEIEPNE